MSPLAHIISAMTDVAKGEGDLTKRLEVKNNDEIGSLATEFNLFIGKVHDIIESANVQTLDMVACVKKWL
jgi:methyl-accepting chemotaxis protein